MTKAAKSMRRRLRMMGPFAKRCPRVEHTAQRRGMQECGVCFSLPWNYKKRGGQANAGQSARVFPTALLICVIAAPLSHAALSPHTGWNLAPGAEDLIQTGSWSCVSQVTASANSLTITAGSAYVTPINTSGPRLLVEGDFSVLATLSAPSSTGTFLTLGGTLSTGTAFWMGLKRLDVGAANGTRSEA